MPESRSRYEVLEPIASGGMGSVFLGRTRGAAGFVGVVAIKRLSPELSSDTRFRHMLIDEAKLSGRVRHPNVVATLDLTEDAGELCLVMEYAHGVTLSRVEALLREQEAAMPLPIALKIVTDVLAGLAAAHDARGDKGEPLEIVHRDISPQNIVVGFDGQARVLDFGIAHAAHRHERTQEGELKGKLSYLAPEQLQQGPIDRRLDIYSVGLVLWELLAGRRARPRATDEALRAALSAEVGSIREHAPDVPEPLVRVVTRALAREPGERYAHAGEMAAALIAACAPAPALAVAPWVRELASRDFEHKERALERAQAAPVSAREIAAGGTFGGMSAPAATPAHDVLTIALSSPPPRRGSRSALRAALVVALGVIAVALALRARLEPAAVNAASRTLPPPALSVALAVADPPAAPSAATTPAPTGSVVGEEMPTPPRARSRLHATVAKSVDTPAPSAVPSASGVSCSPPFTVDDQGFRIPKPGCY